MDHFSCGMYRCKSPIPRQLSLITMSQTFSHSNLNSCTNDFTHQCLPTFHLSNCSLYLHLFFFWFSLQLSHLPLFHPYKFGRWSMYSFRLFPIIYVSTFISFFSHFIPSPCLLMPWMALSPTTRFTSCLKKSSLSLSLVLWNFLCTLSCFKLYTILLNWDFSRQTFITPFSFISISIGWCCDSASGIVCVRHTTISAASPKSEMLAIFFPKPNPPCTTSLSCPTFPTRNPHLNLVLVCLPNHIQHYRMYLSPAGFIQFVVHSPRSRWSDILHRHQTFTWHICLQLAWLRLYIFLCAFSVSCSVVENALECRSQRIKPKCYLCLRDVSSGSKSFLCDIFFQGSSPIAMQCRICRPLLHCVCNLISMFTVTSLFFVVLPSVHCCHRCHCCPMCIVWYIDCKTRQVFYVSDGYWVKLQHNL